MVTVHSSGKLTNNYVKNVLAVSGSFTAPSITKLHLLDLFITNQWQENNAIGIYPYLGGNAAGNRIDFIGAYNLTDFGTFTLNNSTGKQSNGTTGYASTGINPNTLAIDNIAIMAYNSSANTAGNSSAMGGRNVSNTKNTYLQERISTNFFRTCANSTATATTANTNAVGFFYVGRYDGSNYISNNNGNIVNHASSLDRTNIDLFLHGINDNGTIASISGRPYRMHAILIHQSIHDELRTLLDFIYS